MRALGDDGEGLHRDLLTALSAGATLAVRDPDDFLDEVGGGQRQGDAQTEIPLQGGFRRLLHQEQCQEDKR